MKVSLKSKQGTNITIMDPLCELGPTCITLISLGRFDKKLKWLQSLRLNSGMKKLPATAPNFHLLPLSVAESNDYDDFLPLNVLIPVKSVGVITKRDAV